MLKTAKRLIRSLVPHLLWEELRASRNARKVRHVEEICLRQMVRVSQSTTPVPSPARLSKGSPLRRMVIISDVMWERNELVPELERICEVVVHDVQAVLKDIDRQNAPHRIVQSVQRFLTSCGDKEPDVVLLYLRGNLLSDELFTLIRNRWACPLLGINLDDKVQFWEYGSAGGGDHHQQWALKFDLNLTNSKIAVPWYHEAGAACVYLPPGMRGPEGLSAPERAEYERFLGFVGSPKADRVLLVERLRDAGLPVSVYGKDWPDGGWVEDPVKVYRNTQLNLGFGMATPHLSTTKNRDFECPGVGACYLTTFNWELAEWWDIGKEILCYRNTEELIEMACWHKNHPQVCLRIAQAAWKRGHAEHTWELRFRKLFRETGFDV